MSTPLRVDFITDPTQNPELPIPANYNNLIKKCIISDKVIIFTVFSLERSRIETLIKMMIDRAIKVIHDNYDPQFEVDRSYNFTVPFIEWYYMDKKTRANQGMVYLFIKNPTLFKVLSGGFQLSQNDWGFWDKIPFKMTKRTYKTVTTTVVVNSSSKDMWWCDLEEISGSSTEPETRTEIVIDTEDEVDLDPSLFGSVFLYLNSYECEITRCLLRESKIKPLFLSKFTDDDKGFLINVCPLPSLVYAQVSDSEFDPNVLITFGGVPDNYSAKDLERDLKDYSSTGSLDIRPRYNEKNPEGRKFDYLIRFPDGGAELVFKLLTRFYVPVPGAIHKNPDKNYISMGLCRRNVVRAIERGHYDSPTRSPIRSPAHSPARPSSSDRDGERVYLGARGGRNNYRGSRGGQRSATGRGGYKERK